MADDAIRAEIGNVDKLDRYQIEKDYIGTLAHMLEKRHVSCIFNTMESVKLKNGDAYRVKRQVDAFREHLARFVLVDGRLFMSEPEPLVRLSAHTAEVRAEVIRRKGGDFDILRNDHGLELGSLGYFRLNDLDNMRAEMQAIAAELEWLTSERVLAVEIGDESYMRADTDGLSLRELAYSFRQYFIHGYHDNEDDEREAILRVRKRMAALPVEQFLLFQQFDRAVENFAEHGDHAELEDAVARVLETDGIERHYFVYQGNLEKQAREIHRRWNERALSLNDTPTQRLRPC